MKQKQPSNSKKIIPWLGVSALLVCFSTVNAVAEAKTGIPEMLNLNIQVTHADIKDLPKDTKSVKNFTHSKHANEYLKGNSEHGAKPFGDDFTCAACHLEATSAESITADNAQERLVSALNAKGGSRKLKSYFHDICLNCHKSMKKAEKATGPTKCNDCHKRK